MVKTLEFYSTPIQALVLSIIIKFYHLNLAPNNQSGSHSRFLITLSSTRIKYSLSFFKN